MAGSRAIKLSLEVIAEENPDLPYNFIKDIMISLEEEKTEKSIPYKFG